MVLGISIISLGAWCRPAWQVRKHFLADVAYPFDWNITSFSALMHVLHPAFDPAAQLCVEDCYVNPLGSVTDSRSGWIHHHDLPASSVGGFPGSVVMSDGPETLELLKNIREKSAYLFQRLRQHCRSNPVIFLRWIRQGHPDWEFPAAFEGENPGLLHQRLKEFCHHDDVRTLYVVSSDVKGKEEMPSRFNITPTSYGAFVHLFEQVENFPEESWTGDEQSWSCMLNKISEDYLGLSKKLITV